MILTSLVTKAEDAVWLDKGQSAPYQGYLLPEDKLVELRNNTLERDSLKGQNDSLNLSLKLQDDIIGKKDQQLKLYSDQNDKLAQTAYRAENMSNLEKLGFIGLGILLTGLAISGVHALYH
jgi:hypothetical protein